MKCKKNLTTLYIQKRRKKAYFWEIKCFFSCYFYNYPSYQQVDIYAQEVSFVDIKCILITLNEVGNIYYVHILVIYQNDKLKLTYFKQIKN